MDARLVSYGFQYAGILIEAVLVVYLTWSSRRRRQICESFFLSSLLVAQVARACVLHKYGLASPQYLGVYWSTDFLLVISAFILVCFFFQRACAQEEKIWRFVRSLLAFIFVAVVGISILSFVRNHTHLRMFFVVEFNQNLYFTCLVLNTLLYLLLQQIESSDEVLGLLVCGVGIQFAGPAATFALLDLTAGNDFAQSLNSFVIRLCTLGMLLVWAYAILRVQGRATKVTRHEAPVLAGVTADLNV